MRKFRLIRFLRTSVLFGGSAPRPPASIALGQWHETILACSLPGTGLAGTPGPPLRRLLSFRAKSRNLPSAGRLPPAWYMNTCATPTALDTACVSAVRARLRPTGAAFCSWPDPSASLGVTRGALSVSGWNDKGRKESESDNTVEGMPGVRGRRPRSSSTVHPKVRENRMSQDSAAVSARS